MLNPGAWRLFQEAGTTSDSKAEVSAQGESKGLGCTYSQCRVVVADAAEAEAGAWAQIYRL